MFTSTSYKILKPKIDLNFFILSPGWMNWMGVSRYDAGQRSRKVGLWNCLIKCGVAKVRTIIDGRLMLQKLVSRYRPIYRGPGAAIIVKGYRGCRVSWMQEG